MENKVISQKEYLRKYISFGDGDERKKKKKKHKVGAKTVKIIDDDIDLKNMRPIEEGEFDIHLDGEDAPQIAGIIDDRGPVDFSNRERWKIMAKNDDGDFTITGHTINTGKRNNEANAKCQENNDRHLNPSKSSHSKHKQSDSSSHKRSKDNNSDWKPPRQSRDNDSDLSPPRQSKKDKQHKNYDSDLSPPRQSKKNKQHRDYDSDLSPSRQSRKNKQRKSYDSDPSPPRQSKKDKQHKNYDSDLSPLGQYKKDKQHRNYDSDLSPPRQSKKSKQHRNYDSDLSPPGQYKKDKQHRNYDSDLSPPGQSKKSKQHRNYDSDLSPARQYKKDKQHRNYDSDLSPPRQSKKSKQPKNYDSDLSPPRQSRNDDSDLSPPRRSRNNDSDLGLPRRSKNYDSDSSPPRRSKKYDSNLSLPRKSAKHQIRDTIHDTSGRKYRSSGNRNNDSDFSPPRKHKNIDEMYGDRKNKKGSDSDRPWERYTRRDTSPHSSSREVDRRHDYIHKSSSSFSRQDVSGPSKDKRRREYEDRDGRPRYSSDVSKKRRSRWDEETDDPERERAEYSRDRDNRMTKTLDGKTAGLQNAKELQEETETHRRREIEQFSKLSKTFSGVGQAPIMRNKKTGKRRDLEAEAAEADEERERQHEMDEKYAKWGKGLKQVEDYKEKLKNDLYEMSKPLARYADDADLDKEMREQERDGDPMLEYIKQKQIKQGKRKADPPKYQGSYAPNRFGIKPGYRWDGVDRSNGYEKHWFESRNEKTARQEEAYKWSTADM